MIFDLIILGLALWVYVSWCHVAYVVWKRHGAITPLLFVIWVGLGYAASASFLSFFGPAKIVDWIRHMEPSPAQQLEDKLTHMSSITALHLFRLGISYTHILGFALLARIAWLELNGNTGRIMLKRRIVGGIVALLLISCEIKGGSPYFARDSEVSKIKAENSSTIKPLPTSPAGR